MAEPAKLFKLSSLKFRKGLKLGYQLSFEKKLIDYESLDRKQKFIKASLWRVAISLSFVQTIYLLLIGGHNKNEHCCKNVLRSALLHETVRDS